MTIDGMYAMGLRLTPGGPPFVVASVCQHPSPTSPSAPPPEAHSCSSLLVRSLRPARGDRRYRRAPLTTFASLSSAPGRQVSSLTDATGKEVGGIVSEGDEVTHVNGKSVAPLFQHTPFLPCMCAVSAPPSPRDRTHRTTNRQVVSSEGTIRADRLIFGPANSIVVLTVRSAAAGGNEVDLEVRRHMTASAWERYALASPHAPTHPARGTK